MSTFAWPCGPAKWKPRRWKERVYVEIHSCNKCCSRMTELETGTESREDIPHFFPLMASSISFPFSSFLPFQFTLPFLSSIWRISFKWEGPRSQEWSQEVRQWVRERYFPLLCLPWQESFMSFIEPQRLPGLEYYKDGASRQSGSGQTSKYFWN